MKYNILVNILDKVREEAPSENKSYYPAEDDIEKLNNARSRSLIHLFLKVKFGLIDFAEREFLITDGTNDGGIDGYYIDEETKEIYIIQAKFRTNKLNFEEKEITYEELLKMDISGITRGTTEDDNGNKYNGKIQRFIRNISEIPDIPRWKYRIVIMANIRDERNKQIKRITDDFDFEVFNHEKIYQELVYPMVSGSFYNASDLNISLNVSNKNESVIDYNVDTELDTCNITVCFVPTLEIAKIIYKYKNSILKFNPRSYLDLANNTVNPDIRRTILDKKSNEFALFNNGITMLSDETDYSTKSGRRGSAILSLRCPQIINGGQTAFTLGRIYEELIQTKQNIDIFDNKEVMLKVITFDNETVLDEDKKRNLIESISKATNQQTYVSDADRRSNDSVLVNIQEYIYKTFGIFLERKRGEFGDGVRNKYIDRNLIVEREVLLRIALSINGRVYETKTGDKKIYTENNLKTFFNVKNSVLNKYIFGYKAYLKLGFFNSNDIDRYGFSLKYGKYAVIYALSQKFDESWGIRDYDEKLNEILEPILKEWNEFEEFAKSKDTQSKYFNEKNANFLNYYKGRTLNRDLKEYYSKKI